MKEWRKILLTALVCLLPLAAAGEGSLLDAEKQETLKASALILVEQLETGNFDQAIATFAPELKAQLGIPQLEAAMAQMNGLAGAYQEMIGAIASLQDGVAVI